MEKWEIRPSLHQKPLKRSSLKFARVITSGTPTTMQNFITVRLPSLYPPPFQICENAHQVTRLVFWFFLPPTARTPAPILRSIRQMTRFRARMCHWGPENKILHFDLISPQNANFSPIVDGTFSCQKGLNNGDAHL